MKSDHATTKTARADASTATAPAGRADGTRPTLPPVPAPNFDGQVLGRGDFVNRELSWLQFNRRVLDEALDESNRPLERLKFLAIASTNLDEFFEIRVAGTRDRAEAGLPPENPNDLSPREELAAIKQDAARLAQDMHACFKDLLVPSLEQAGILFPAVDDLSPEHKQWIQAYFEREVYPVLTPLAVDPAHPFPSLLNKSLNLALLLLDPRQKRAVHRIAVVQVPRALPRLIRLPAQSTSADKRHYVFMVDLIREHIDSLFPGLEMLHVCSFRVTRDGNIDYGRRVGSRRPDGGDRAGAQQASPR